jgi:hypothetical protein
MYHKICAKIQERDHNLHMELDAKLEESRAHNWPEKLFEMRQTQIIKLEDNLAADRALAQR